MSISEVHRDLSFCSHTIAGYCKNPLIIHDTHLSELGVNHPAVLNEPFVRFYAGACIKVGSYNIGTLSVTDVKPRPDFDERCSDILLDMADVAAEMFISGCQNRQNRELDSAKMSIRILYNLKHPLNTLDALMNELRSQLQESSSSSSLMTSIDSLFGQFKKNVSVLSTTIETNLSIVQTKYQSNQLEGSDNKLEFGSTESSLMEELQISFQTMISFASLYNSNSVITWQLEDKYIFQTYSSLLNTVLYTSVLHYIRIWSTINVKIFFQKKADPKSEKLMINRINTINTTDIDPVNWKEQSKSEKSDVGFLIVNICCYDRVVDIGSIAEAVSTVNVVKSLLVSKPSRRRTIDDSDLLHANNDLLSLIKGGCKLLSEDTVDHMRNGSIDENKLPSKILYLWMPCKVILN